MGIKKLLVLWGIVAGTQLFAQNVTNVDCYQDGNNITITYNVDQKASTELFYSRNGGTTFIGPLKCVTGDIGANAKKGYNKAIWSVLDEVESLVGNQICFKVSVKHKEQKVKDNKNQQPQKKHQGAQRFFERLGAMFFGI